MPAAKKPAADTRPVLAANVLINGVWYGPAYSNEADYPESFVPGEHLLDPGED